MTGFIPEQKTMEMNKIDKLKNVPDNQEQMTAEESDDASKLWKQYQNQKNKKNLSKIFLFSFVILIIVVLAFVGLYIVLSTTDPLHGI